MMGEDPGELNLHDDLVSSIAATGGCTSARTGLYLDYHELMLVKELCQELNDMTPGDTRSRILDKIAPVIEASEASHRIFKQTGTCVEDM